MKYVQLGNSRLIVSRLAFGAMTFGSGNVPSVYKVGQDQAQDLVTGRSTQASISSTRRTVMNYARATIPVTVQRSANHSFAMPC